MTQNWFCSLSHGGLWENGLLGWPFVFTWLWRYDPIPTLSSKRKQILFITLLALLTSWSWPIFFPGSPSICSPPTVIFLDVLFPWCRRHTLYVVKKSRSHQNRSGLAVHSPVIITPLSERKMWFYHKHSHDDSALNSCQRRTAPSSPPLLSMQAAVKKHLLPNSFLY